MQNKQLERQLRAIIQRLKGAEITQLIESIQQEEGFLVNKNFTKSGINCTCCTLTHGDTVATGFGRNQSEAQINATKNYLEVLVSTDTMIPALKHALKIRENPIQIQLTSHDQTLDLKELTDISAITEQQQDAPVGCSCVYYEVHQHHMTEIKNLEARMKLIVKQNEMLKQLLLKESQKPYERQHDKENYSRKANCA